jgi:two-component system phosphate regulon sensor histidine kinase PhoR
LGLSFLALVLAILACADWFAASTLRSQVVRDRYSQLVRLGRAALEHPPHLENAQALDTWLGQFSASGARVVVIASDGHVQADSQHQAELENQAEQTEIRDALASPSGQGQAVRYDPGLRRDVEYFALRDTSSASPVVLRFALPLPSIEEELLQFRRKLWLASLVLVLIAAAMAIVTSQRYSSRMEQLRESVKHAAAGDFSPVPRDYSKDDLAELSNALGGTVAEFGQTIRTLTEERNRSAAILSSMIEGVAVVGSNERILYCNRAFEQILELHEGSSQGKKLVEALRQAELVSAVRQVLPGGEEVTGELEVGTIRRRSFSVTAAPVQGARENSAVLVLHDITELRRLERVRRDFVANVSHEFKTPLTAIQGFAETLLGGALDDKANRARFVEIIREHSQRLARLTDDLLKLSRIEAGQLDLELRSVNVEALINSCVETARFKAESKGLHIHVQVQPGIPAVRGDNARLAEVLQNLVDNAMQYTPPSGRIDVQARAEDHSVVFTVADTGIGIPESDLERIFERFYRVDAARSREAGGTGLGLSIARHIVEAHGGRIWVESAIGQGSRFHFSIASA